MDQFTEADELDETGVLFTCGEDLLGRPTLVARPTVHEPASREESLTAARRTVFTVQRCCEVMPSWLEEQKVVILYDCRGLKRANLDLTYTREIIRTLLAQFPERLDRVVVINSHWTMSFFWAAIKALLPSDVVAKVHICSSDTVGMCKEFLPEDHPYILYDAAVRRGGLVPDVPKRSRYRDAKLAPKADVEGEAEENESSDEELEPEPAMLGEHWSRQSTTASTEVGATPVKKASFSPWHPDGAAAAAGVPTALQPEVGRTYAEVAEAAVERRWWSAGCCVQSISNTRTSL